MSIFESRVKKESGPRYDPYLVLPHLYNVKQHSLILVPEFVDAKIKFWIIDHNSFGSLSLSVLGSKHVSKIHRLETYAMRHICLLFWEAFEHSEDFSGPSANNLDLHALFFAYMPVCLYHDKVLRNAKV